MVSGPDTRILLQLHPSVSLFIGSKTISIVPEEHGDLPILSPSQGGYDSYRDQVSQKPSSIRIPDTPGSKRIRMLLSSSPAQSRSLVKQMATSAIAGNENSQTWSPNPLKRSLLGVIRDASKKSRTEPRPHPSLDSQPETAVNDLGALSQWTDTTIDLEHDEKAGGVAKEEQTEDEDDVRNAGMTDENHLVLQMSLSPPPMKRGLPVSLDGNIEMVDHRDAQKAVTVAESNNVRSSPPHADSPRSRRQKLQPMPASSSATEETQDSMKSNIVVQDPFAIQIRDVQSAIPIGYPVPGNQPEHSRSKAGSHEQEKSKVFSDAIYPSSSMRSTKSTPKEESHSPQSQPPGIRILFASSTTVDNSKQQMRFLEKQGVKRVSTVSDCTILCVSKSAELKKTSKLIMAVLQGKEVITDDWVARSANEGRLLDMEAFKARDPEREAGWAINLDEAIGRGKQTGSKPFNGWTIAFTSAAKKDAGNSGFADLKEIAACAGAKSCSTVLPKKSPDESPSLLIIGCQAEAPPAALKGSWRLFTRDIIGLSCLRGQVDTVSDEFLVTNERETSKGKPDRKRKR